MREFDNVSTPEDPSAFNQDTLALVLIECWPGGPVVKNRSECLEINQKPSDLGLPSLELTGEDLASNTKKSNGGGEMLNERDAHLDRLYA